MPEEKKWKPTYAAMKKNILINWMRFEKTKKKKGNANQRLQGDVFRKYDFQKIWKFTKKNMNVYQKIFPYNLLQLRCSCNDL